MDKTEKYIEMCKKAIEIQEHRYYRVQESNNYEDGDFFVGCTSMDNDLFIDTAPVGDFIRPKTWLPRQDQLQEIYYKYVQECNNEFIHNSHYLNAVSFLSFKVWLDKKYTDADSVNVPTNNFSSGEQLWMAFVMQEKYNKVWDGKEWNNG